jgi:6-phosphogluconolactonase
MIHKGPNAAEECGRHILGILDAKPRSTLAISGGSSPAPMFKLFAACGFDWSRVDLFWVDERGVPPDDSQSNFKLANDLWLKPAGVPEANIHRMKGELDAVEAARIYTDEIRETFKLVPGDLPEFDVIHQGMGPDGHTASLFPGEPMIDDRRGIAAGLWVEKMKQWRITLLPGVLLAARHTAMLLAGDKGGMLRQVLDGPYNPKVYPAQVVLSARDVQWFVAA